MTTPDADGAYLPPLIPPAPLRNDGAERLIAAINTHLLAAATWRCPGCIPRISVTLTGGEWTEHIHHTRGCSALAARLLDTEGNQS